MKLHLQNNLKDYLNKIERDYLSPDLPLGFFLPRRVTNPRGIWGCPRRPPLNKDQEYKGDDCRSIPL
jgi:hypothetical protein